MSTPQAWTNAHRMREGIIQGVSNRHMGQIRKDRFNAPESLFYKGEESFDLQPSMFYVYGKLFYLPRF